MRQLNQPINEISRWISGENLVGTPSDKDTLNRNAPDFPAAPEPKAKTLAATEAEAQTADAVADAVSQSSAAPSVANAVSEMGVRPGAVLSPGQIDRASEQIVRSYRDNATPETLKTLMRQGKFTEAKALQEFVRDADAQEGMKAWSGAVFAALGGDVDTAAEKMVEAYNASGYFQDGFEIVRDQTELLKNENGEVVGLKLARRNLTTGEVTVETGDVSDLIQRGIWLLSPEKAMEQYVARQQAMAERFMRLEDERRKAQTDLIKQDQKAGNDAALEIYKAHIGLDGQPTISFDEARQLAAGGGQAEEGDVPMLRRP